MDYFFLWILALLAIITIYRKLSTRWATPKARVTALLRRYYVFERAGLPEQESLLRVLGTRSGWKNLPPPFLTEVVSRLSSKEDVFRFVSLSEGYGYIQRTLPDIAKKENLEEAMAEIACLLGKLGKQLQDEGRFKEAEFVQRLALRLQPDQYFTNLPLAVTYYRMEQYGDAIRLFKRGLAQFEKFEKEVRPAEPISEAAGWLGADGNLGELKASYRNLYDACLKAKRAEGEKRG